MSPEELAEARHYATCYQAGYVHDLMHNFLAHIDQQAARIAELDGTASGPLENIAKMLETVNADTIFSGIIQTWKNENQTLKTRIAELEKDLEATEKRVREHEEHENQTHEILGKILGTDNTLENVARRAISKITELEKKNAVLEAQVTTLKKIAISERSRCIRTESYDHCEGMYRIDLPEAIESSRRQLAEEHPEAFR